MSKRVLRRATVLAKIEGTEGTDPTAAGTDAVRITGDAELEIGAEFNNPRDSVITGTLDVLAPLASGGKMGKLTITSEARGYGSAYSSGNKPEWDALLRAAGTTVSTSFTGGSEYYRYDTNTGAPSAFETVAIYVYGDGILWKLLAGRMDGEVRFPAGGPATLKATITGLLTQAADTSLVSGTYQSAVPPIGKALTFSYNAVSTLIVREATYTFGNTIVPRPSVNASDALAGYLITSRKSAFSFTAEAPLVATADFESDRFAATSRVLSLTFGSTQYNRLKFDADKFTPAEVRYGGDGGIRTVTVSGPLSNEGTNRARLAYD